MTPTRDTLIAWVKEKIATLKKRLVYLETMSSRWTEAEEVQRELTWFAALHALLVGQRQVAAKIAAIANDDTLSEDGIRASLHLLLELPAPPASEAP